jgi:hypothetical protein
MRPGEPGDAYLHFVDATSSGLDGEYRALSMALLKSALADLWCVRLGDVHQSKCGKRIETIYGARRAPRTPAERANRRAAVAWIKGAAGTAEEPLRWVDVCEALGFDPVGLRRIVLEVVREPVVRRETVEAGWQAQPVPA